MASPLVSALGPLRKRALDSASRFADYNFRTYFTKHATDTFDGAEAKLKEGNIAAFEDFITVEAPMYVDQIDRMSHINQLYSKVQTVTDSRQK